MKQGVQGTGKIMPDSKIKNIFWILSANKQQLGYCLRTHALPSEWASFSLVSIEYYDRAKFSKQLLYYLELT